MNTIIIPLSFCIIISILIWFIIGLKGSWHIKAIVTSFCLYFAIAVWYSLFSYLGWPSKDSLPSKYLVYWAQIEEPNPVSNGAIYIWVLKIDAVENQTYNIFNYSNRKNEPRIHEIPYSKSLHQNVQKMMEEIKKGSIYIGGQKSLEDKKIDNNIEGKGQFGFSYKSKDQYLYPLPPARVPEKIKNAN